MRADMPAFAQAHGSPVVGHQLQMRPRPAWDAVDTDAEAERWRTVHNSNSAEQRTHIVEAGLAAATWYELRVASVNEVGVGEYSQSVEALTGATPPGVPAAPKLKLLKLTPRGNENEHAICVRWQPPVDTGGSPITGCASLQPFVHVGPVR